jgi:hypothetical protein
MKFRRSSLWQLITILGLLLLLASGRPGLAQAPAAAAPATRVINEALGEFLKTRPDRYFAAINTYQGMKHLVGGGVAHKPSGRAPPRSPSQSRSPTT